MKKCLTETFNFGTMKIFVEDKIESVCPSFVGACVEADVENSEYSEELWQLIDELGEQFRQTLTTESLKDISAIAATRRVYKACGKDPSRYRPSSEALIRRMLQGKKLYQIDTLVDLINLASIKYGYSIGGFDGDKFDGDTLTLGVGREGEPYEGIGRGMLNIMENMLINPLSEFIFEHEDQLENRRILIETFVKGRNVDFDFDFA